MEGSYPNRIAMNSVGYVSRLLTKINTAYLIETGGFFNVDFSTNAGKF